MISNMDHPTTTATVDENAINQVSNKDAPTSSTCSGPAEKPPPQSQVTSTAAAIMPDAIDTIHPQPVAPQAEQPSATADKDMQTEDDPSVKTGVTVSAVEEKPAAQAIDKMEGRPSASSLSPPDGHAATTENNSTTSGETEQTKAPEKEQPIEVSSVAKEPCASLSSSPIAREMNSSKSENDMRVDAERKAKAEDATGKAEESTPSQVASSNPSASEQEDASNAKQKSKEEEMEVDEQTTLQDIWEALCDLDTPGSTCAGGKASNMPSVPGLHIDGIGHVPLPLTDQMAQQVASVATQAPHGRGLETVLDKSVRNTLQIDPSKVTLCNPSWQSELQKLVSQTAVALGVNPSLVRAELYKLLLYEKGGFFKKHRDTEKAGGMFATLVIQLPSQFTGGSFVVSHCSDRQTFTLGAGEDAAYGCHYVSHYADCEHEILPVESGHRLALIYSLCYTGVGRPSAADFSHRGLTTLLQGLCGEDSMFVIPLEHQYTSSSLARLGVGALKGSDRAKQEAIQVAGGGSWRMLIAKLSRTDQESGSGDGYYGDFEVYDSYQGSPELSDTYHADGSDAAAEKDWVWQSLNLTSVEDDGMILGSEEEIEEMWGEGDSGSVEYTGNEGATRETTYNTYVLIAYSEDTAFERMCACDFKQAVALVEESPKLFDRLLDHIRSKKPSIASRECLKLLSLVKFGEPSAEKAGKNLQTILGCLDTCSVPSSSLADALVDLVRQQGWSSTTEPIRSLVVERLKLCKASTSASFLDKIDLIMRFAKTNGADFVPPVVAEAVQSFSSVPAPSSSSTSYYSYGYSTSVSDDSADTVMNKLVALSQRHGWKLVEPSARACFLRLRSMSKTDPDQLVKRLGALQGLRARIAPCDIEDLRQEVVKDFVEAIEKDSSTNSTNNRNYSYHSRPKSVFAVSGVDSLMRVLFETGVDDDFRRIEAWAANQNLEQVSKLLAIVDRVAKEPRHAKDQSALASQQRFVASVQGRCNALKLSQLHERHKKLLHDTRNGEPTFSWSMPNALVSNAPLKAFLQSSRSGPEVVVVGGGINNARALARSGRSYGRSYSRSYSQSQQGYSAKIEALTRTGQSSSVHVTKTRTHYDSLVAKYRQNRNELAKTEAEIQKLGGHVPALSATMPQATAAGAAGMAVAAGVPGRRVMQVDGAQAAPQKKQRTKGPAIPEDADIIEID